MHPVRMAAMTTLAIVRRAEHEWYERVIQLLEYIHGQYPDVQPDKYEQIISDIKVDVSIGVTSNLVSQSLFFFFFFFFSLSLSLSDSFLLLCL